MQEILDEMRSDLKSIGTPEARIEKILKDFVEQNEAIAECK